MHKSIILITIPSHDDTTRYLSAWSKQVTELAHQKKDKILILKDKQANLREFTNIIKKNKPSFIFFNGHGNETTITGHNNQPLVKANKNVEILKNTIVYALSCQSARKLGPRSIKQGTKTYIGYTEDFIFIYDIKKKKQIEKDEIAGCFLSSSNQVAVSLLEDKTTGQAYIDSQNAFKKTIHSLLTSESRAEQSSMIRYLIWDMKHQVCLGDQNAQI